LKTFKPDLVPACADCRSTSLEEQLFKLSPLTRRRSATQLSRENPRLNDFGRSFVVQPAEVINNDIMDVNLGIWLT